MLDKMDGEIRIVMEATGVYHLPILSYFYEKDIGIMLFNKVEKTFMDTV